QVALDFLAFSGRSPEAVELVEAYMKEQGLFFSADTPEPEYSDTLELDLGAVEPSLAGPRRPQDRVRLSEVKAQFERELALMLAAPKSKPALRPKPVLAMVSEGGLPCPEPAEAEPVLDAGVAAGLHHGAVV